jgi:DHA1 family multidrug resistance protein-like MFS transporter
VPFNSIAQDHFTTIISSKPYDDNELPILHNDSVVANPAAIMLEIIREAPLGQAIRLISRNRLLRYPEELPDFELPVQYRLLIKSEGYFKKQHHEPTSYSPEVVEQDDSVTPHHSETLTDEDPDLEALEQLGAVVSIRTAPYSAERMRAERELDRTKSLPIAPQKSPDGTIFVDWYTTDDPANPQNWSSFKKNFVVFVLCFYTWTVYCAGPIYAASEPGVVEKFHISPVAASLGLSLYVLAYGIGDLLFSPLTEIPIIGRNPVYCKHQEALNRIPKLTAGRLNIPRVLGSLLPHRHS